MDWNDYPNFSAYEFADKKTGKVDMDAAFMKKLQTLRTIIGRPIIISSGYREPTHPAEINKKKRGEHTYGRAADIKCHGAFAHELLGLAIALGFPRIGLHQKGDFDGRFIHLGTSTQEQGFLSPHPWTY